MLKYRDLQGWIHDFEWGGDASLRFSQKNKNKKKQQEIKKSFVRGACRGIVMPRFINIHEHP